MTKYFFTCFTLKLDRDWSFEYFDLLFQGITYKKVFCDWTYRRLVPPQFFFLHNGWCLLTLYISKYQSFSFTKQTQRVFPNTYNIHNVDVPFRVWHADSAEYASIQRHLQYNTSSDVSDVNHGITFFTCGHWVQLRKVPLPPFRHVTHHVSVSRQCHSTEGHLASSPVPSDNKKVIFITCNTLGPTVNVDVVFSLQLIILHRHNHDHVTPAIHDGDLVSGYETHVTWSVILLEVQVSDMLHFCCIVQCQLGWIVWPQYKQTRSNQAHAIEHKSLVFDGMFTFEWCLTQFQTWNIYTCIIK